MIEHILMLDVLKQGYQQHLGGFKAGEANVRQISVILTAGGRMLVLPESADAELYVKKPDGTICHSTCEIDSEHNKITHIMTTSEVSAPGRLECEVRIQLPRGDNDTVPVLYSPCFDVVVDDTIYTENAAISQNENSEWTKTLQRISDVEDGLEEYVSILEAKADSSLLDQKADKSELDMKADKSQLNDKADKSELEQKADKSELGDRVYAVPKTAEMTEAVGIDEDGRLWFDPKAGEELKVTSFSVLPSGFLEKGVVLDDVTVSWKANKSVVYTEVAVVWDSGIVEARFEPADGAGDRSAVFEGLGIVCGMNPRAVLTVSKSASMSGESVNKSIALTYANRVYLGAAEMPETLTGEFVRSISAGILSDRRQMAKTVTADGMKYIWYACPASGMNTPVFYAGGFEGGFEMEEVIDVTNSSGYTEAYQLWRSTQPGLGTVALEVR